MCNILVNDAVKKNKLEVLKNLLQTINVDIEDFYDYTPLYNAVQNKSNIKITALLIEYRANVSAKNSNGFA